LAKRTFDPNLKTVLWIYHVEIDGIENYLKYIDHDVLIYDCVDNYAGFPKYDTPEKKERINSQEQFLATRANLVFATAPGLVDKMKKYNTHVYYTPNVADFEKFKNARNLKKQLPPEIEIIPRPRVGFYGAVDEYKFDKELFRRIASDLRGYSFIIIGNIALKDREATPAELGFGDLTNIHFLGSKKYEELEYYMAGFDVFIIPYQLNDYTVGGCFPIKFHEALAAGIPTVVTDMPAYTPFESVCYISKSYSEFSQNIRLALETDNEDKIKERQRVAKDNDWDGKVARMVSLITEYLSKH
jgi:glycosyltransferase involved in cell wall biosynthesis